MSTAKIEWAKKFKLTETKCFELTIENTERIIGTMEKRRKKLKPMIDVFASSLFLWNWHELLIRRKKKDRGIHSSLTSRIYSVQTKRLISRPRIDWLSENKNREIFSSNYRTRRKIASRNIRSRCKFYFYNSKSSSLCVNHQIHDEWEKNARHKWVGQHHTHTNVINRNDMRMNVVFLVNWPYWAHFYWAFIEFRMQ